MAGGSGRVYNANGCSNISVLLQNSTVPCAAAAATSEASESFFLSGPSSSSFLGSRSMVSFEDARDKSGKSFFRPYDHEDNGDEELDEYFHQPEKKRRLTAEQVQFLEKNFELENKLEPERKIQLAKDLGLQPRQVAIWFQNRRARWKTKQLEKDYDVLQSSYKSLKTDYKNLLKEKERLKAEVLDLTDKLQHREKERGNSSELSNGIKLSEEPLGRAVLDPVSETDASKLLCKQEDISPAKSDIFDSESPHYTDGVHSASVLEPGDSSYIFEPDQSDLSQDEEDDLSKGLMPTYIFPKIEEADYSDPPATSCNFGFSVEDQAFWSSWSTY